MDFYNVLLNLVKAGSLLRGDPRSAYLVNEMQNERGENKLREQIYGPAKSDGITWNGARALPTGNVEAMIPQHEALPPVPTRRFIPELRAEGIEERKNQLMQMPEYQRLAEKQMFAPPKPPKFMEASGGIAKIDEDAGTAGWALEPPTKAPEGTELSKYQTELDAMGPNDPRRPTWQAKITRLAQGEPQAPKVAEPDWHIMTDPEKIAKGIPVSATVKTNGKDFQVMTQPKQDAPTESQQKAGTLAGRIVDALKNTSEIVAKDPGATTNWMLSTFGDNEYVGPGVKKYTNPNAQIFKNEMTDAIDAIITLGTGAAYTGEQLIAARNAYLPQPGEPDEVKNVKRKKLMNTYGLAKTAARAAGVDLPEPAVLDPLYGIKAEQPAAEKPPEGLPPGAVKQADGTYKDPATGEIYVWQE